MQLTGALPHCWRLLKEIQDMPKAEEFLLPVYWKDLNLPEYPKAITSQMDLHLHTIETSYDPYTLHP